MFRGLLDVIGLAQSHHGTREQLIAAPLLEGLHEELRLARVTTKHANSQLFKDTGQYRFVLRLLQLPGDVTLARCHVGLLVEAQTTDGVVAL